MKIGVLFTIYVDNDKAYEEAKKTLSTFKSKHELIYYARISKLTKGYRDILKGFHSVKCNDRNILARSWNLGIKEALKDCKYVIFPNLDIELKDYTIDNLVDFAMGDDSIIWSGRCTNTGAKYPEGDFIVNSYTVYDNFAFPMVNKRLFKEVGEFDENFIPAYGEDVDMQYRLELLGKKHTCVENAPFIHFGQVTVNNSPDWVGVNPTQVDEYFVKKWGGIPRQHKFKKPFNK